LRWIEPPREFSTGKTARSAIQSSTAWNATSNWSHGMASQFGYAFPAAASEYAPGTPWYATLSFEPCIGAGERSEIVSGFGGSGLLLASARFPMGTSWKSLTAALWPLTAATWSAVPPFLSAEEDCS